MHPEPLLDEAAVPERMQALARAAPRSDVIATLVVAGRRVQGLVDVAHPMAKELERRQLLLVGCLRRCQDGKVILDRAHHAFCSHWALIPVETGRVAREIDEVLGGSMRDHVGRPVT